MKKRIEVSQEDIDEIWDLKLDECSISFIHECKVTHLSRRTIASVYNGEVPERFKDDERLLPHRFVWMSAWGFAANDGKDIGFVVLKLPWGVTQANYRKFVTAVRKDFSSISEKATLNPYVTEPIELDIAQKFVVVRGTPGWQMSLDGSATRLGADDFEKLISQSPRF
jgi:hypothetical protein